MLKQGLIRTSHETKMERGEVERLKSQKVLKTQKLEMKMGN